MADQDSRSPISVGIEWSAKISTIGFEFAVPALFGHFLDRQFGSNPIGLLVGMVLGFSVGMLHILRIARDASKPT